MFEFDRSLIFLQRLADEYSNFHVDTETQDMLRIYAADQIDLKADEDFKEAIERDLAMKAEKAKSPYHLDRSALLGPDPYDENNRTTMTATDVIRQLAMYQSMTPAVGSQPLTKLKAKS